MAHIGLAWMALTFLMIPYTRRIWAMDGCLTNYDYDLLMISYFRNAR